MRPRERHGPPSATHRLRLKWAKTWAAAGAPGRGAAGKACAHTHRDLEPRSLNPPPPKSSAASLKDLRRGTDTRNNCRTFHKRLQKSYTLRSMSSAHAQRQLSNWLPKQEGKGSDGRVEEDDRDEGNLGTGEGPGFPEGAGCRALHSSRHACTPRLLPADLRVHCRGIRSTTARGGCLHSLALNAVVLALQWRLTPTVQGMTAFWSWGAENARNLKDNTGKHFGKPCLNWEKTDQFPDTAGKGFRRGALASCWVYWQSPGGGLGRSCPFIFGVQIACGLVLYGVLATKKNMYRSYL